MYKLALVTQEKEWSHTAAIVAIVHNALAKTAKLPSAFNPITVARNMDDNDDYGSEHGPGQARMSGLSIAEARKIVEGMNNAGS